jgi:hypothetical protein
VPTSVDVELSLNAVSLTSSESCDVLLACTMAFELSDN